MKPSILPSTIFILISVIAGTAHAQMTERFATIVPTEWNKVHEDDNSEEQLVVYSPGEFHDDWTKVLSIQTRLNRPGRTHKEIYQQQVATMNADCPGAETRVIADGTENGYEFTFALNSCPMDTKTKMGMVSLFKSIQGETSVYGYQFIWRVPPFSGSKSGLPLNEIALMTSFAKKAKVCDDAKADRACAPIIADLSHIETLEITKKN